MKIKIIEIRTLSDELEKLECIAYLKLLEDQEPAECPRS